MGSLARGSNQGGCSTHETTSQPETDTVDRDRVRSPVHRARGHERRRGLDRDPEKQRRSAAAPAELGQLVEGPERLAAQGRLPRRPGSGGAGGSRPTGPSGTSSPGFTAETLSQTGNTDSSTTSTSFTNLNNATLNVTVPSGETDKLVVFFSGESACYGGSDVQTCLLKINVDGTELSPQAGSDAAFDNNVTTRTPFDAKRSTYRYQHTIVRTSGNLSAGSHQVVVQYSVSDSTVAFNLDDWALVVQRIKVS
jgi:hypothetical protein